MEEEGDIDGPIIVASSVRYRAIAYTRAPGRAGERKDGGWMEVWRTTFRFGIEQLNEDGR